MQGHIRTLKETMQARDTHTLSSPEAGMNQTYERNQVIKGTHFLLCEKGGISQDIKKRQVRVTHSLLSAEEEAGQNNDETE